MLDVPSDRLLRAIFDTLAYADVFDYPLTVRQIHRYLTSTKASIEQVAQILAVTRPFSRVGDYFTLRGREEIVQTRLRRKKVAEQLWAQATRYGRFIGSLPFVRMVAVTGSLAMDNTEEGNDIDFMIVTAPDHLWTSRALSLLVARLAKFEGVHLCPNYLLTTRALELKERSLYVAHELAQMIPISGLDVHQELLCRNQWMNDYLPNVSVSPESPYSPEPTPKQSTFQRILERILSLPFGAWFENWERDRKIERLSREQADSLESFFSADVCKGHIDRHGENLATALRVRLKETV